MPTGIATLGRERSIGTLARRVFNLGAGSSAALRRRAEEALVSANPHLASSEGFAAGNPVIVPAVSGLSHTAEVTTASANDQGLSLETHVRLQALGAQIDAHFQRASQQRKATLQQLGDSQFVKQARAALPESAKLITSAKKRLKTEETQAAEVVDRFQKAVAEALKTVKALDEMARKEGSG